MLLTMKSALMSDAWTSNFFVNYVYVAAHCQSRLGRSHAAGPSVIVIGAGFGGIAAARALYDASIQVLLYIFYIFC